MLDKKKDSNLKSSTSEQMASQNDHISRTTETPITTIAQSEIQSNSIDELISDAVTTTQLNFAMTEEVTTLSSVDSEKSYHSEQDLKMFSLFSNENANNNLTIFSANPNNTFNHTSVLDKSMETNVSSPNKTNTKPFAENNLEARNLSDDPKLEDFSNQLAKAENVEQNNATENSMKLENVAHILNSIFNVLGLTGKTANEQRKQTVSQQSVPQSMVLVQDDGHSLPSMVASSSGAQVEIITAQPPKLNTAKTGHSERVIGASMQSHQVASILPKAHMTETVKSMRDLPQGAINYPNMNVPLDKAKMHTFSNGWRAIPNLKPNIKPRPPQFVPAVRPNFIEKKDELANKTDLVKINAPVTTTVKPDAASNEANNTSMHNTAEVTTRPSDIDISKGKVHLTK